MRLTRTTIKKTKQQARNYFNHHKSLKNKSLIYQVGKFICRSNNIIIDYDRKVLDNIEFFYDSINRHWAETDGKKIYINTYKKLTENLLYYTLLHESFHGMIKRHNNHELSEPLEHRMMYLLDRRLIE
jgi:hypothetical protein